MPSINGSVTQGAADAYAEGEIQTALSGQTRQAYRVKGIEYEFSFVQFPAAAAAQQDVDLCITRRTKTAMALITDVDVIKKWSFGGQYQTAVGANTGIENVGLWVPPLDVLIVEDPIYLSIDSTATGLTITGYVRIDYELVTISETDRLTLLVQSLV